MRLLRQYLAHARLGRGQSSHLPPALCPLAAKGQRPHRQGCTDAGRLAGDSDFLRLWRVGVSGMAYQSQISGYRVYGTKVRGSNPVES